MQYANSWFPCPYGRINHTFRRNWLSHLQTKQNVTGSSNENDWHFTFYSLLFLACHNVMHIQINTIMMMMIEFDDQKRFRIKKNVFFYDTTMYLCSFFLRRPYLDSTTNWLFFLNFPNVSKIPSSSSQPLPLVFGQQNRWNLVYSEHQNKQNERINQWMRGTFSPLFIESKKKERKKWSSSETATVGIIGELWTEKKKLGFKLATEKNIFLGFQ